MTGNEQDGARTDRVFDGEIQDGFRKYRRRESMAANGDPTVLVEKFNRQHRHKNGYQDVGPAKELVRELTVRDARAIRDLLEDWLQEVDSNE